MSAGDDASTWSPTRQDAPQTSFRTTSSRMNGSRSTSGNHCSYWLSCQGDIAAGSSQPRHSSVQLSAASKAQDSGGAQRPKR